MRFYQSPEDYNDTATRQAALARDLASRILAGEPTEKHERGFIAAILKDWADTLPLQQKRPAGQQPKFCHGSAAREYAIRRSDGTPHGVVADDMAEDYGVSRPAIEKAIKANKKEVDELIAMLRKETNSQE